jgi:hypothetical protein
MLANIKFSKFLSQYILNDKQTYFELIEIQTETIVKMEKFK